MNAEELAISGTPVFICDRCKQIIEAESDYVAKIVRIYAQNKKCKICGNYAHGSLRQIWLKKDWNLHLKKEAEKNDEQRIYTRKQRRHCY